MPVWEEGAHAGEKGLCDSTSGIQVQYVFHFDHEEDGVAYN